MDHKFIPYLTELAAKYSVAGDVQVELEEGAVKISCDKGKYRFFYDFAKELPQDEFLAEAMEIAGLCRRYGTPLFINDNVDIAIACHADGVHVGQSDLEAAEVRRRVGDGMMIGVSVHTVEEALTAVRNGADCLGVGAMFATSTKTDVDVLSMETLRDICHAVEIPVVAIGGINRENIAQLAGTGVDGVALVSAIFAADDIETECRHLLELAEEMVKR